MCVADLIELVGTGFQVFRRRKPKYIVRLEESELLKNQNVNQLRLMKR